jgi:hypothetical protein
MHGGGAKRASFKKNFQTRVKFKICFKFGLKIKKILRVQESPSCKWEQGLKGLVGWLSILVQNHGMQIFIIIN